MNWRGNISNRTCSFPKEGRMKRTADLAKKLVITGILLSSLTMTAEASATALEKDLSTVYHVYIGKEYMGAVTDQNLVEDLLQQKVSNTEKEFEGLHIDINKKLTYVPEQVFRPIANNEETIEKIEQSIVIQADAIAIKINNQPVVYVKDESEAKAVLDKLQYQYVSEADIRAFEMQKELDASLPALAENELRIVNVKWKENVSLEPARVEPDKIYTLEKALSFFSGASQEAVHTVVEGDGFEKIANKYSLSSEQLKALNPGINEESIEIGQTFRVAVSDPMLHVLVEKEAYTVETLAYEKEVVEDSTMYKGETKIVQEGKEGKVAHTYIIKEENGIQREKNIIKEEILQEPVKHIVHKGTMEVPAENGTGTGSFTWPANGGYISSKQGYRWGKMHKGIDIARPDSYEIKAADNGVVVSAGFDNGGYGNQIIIDHHNGYKTMYAHLDSIAVSVGDTVTQGQQIGIMGQTGDSTGTHLHFEVYKDGALQNPLDYL